MKNQLWHYIPALRRLAQALRSRSGRTGGLADFMRAQLSANGDSHEDVHDYSHARPSQQSNTVRSRKRFRQLPYNRHTVE